MATNYGSMDQAAQNLVALNGQPPARRRRSVKKEAAVQMAENAPEVLEKYWTAIKRGLDKGEKYAVDAVSQAFGYTKAAGGLTVLQAMQINNAPREGGGPRSFESIIRKLETEAEDQGPLAQPEEEVEESESEDEEDDEDILDGDPEDEPEDEPDEKA